MKLEKSILKNKDLILEEKMVLLLIQEVITLNKLFNKFIKKKIKNKKKTFFIKIYFQKF